ncbi:MAG: SMP-30/gluconolactonase/LRE family protein [Candidatus Thiodiazotropha sp.]
MNRLLVTLFSMLIASCAAKTPYVFNLEDGQSTPVWPAAPERPRIQFITSFSKPEDLNIGKGFVQLLTEFFTGSEENTLSRPYAIAVHGRRIAVADPDSARVHIFNLNDRSYHTIDDTENHLFQSPIGVALDDNRLFIADSKLNKVFVFDRQYSLTRVLESFTRPTALALDTEQQTLYVTDTLAHKIYAYETDGDLIRTIGKRGEANDQFNYPSHLALAKDRLVINDTMNFRIQSYDREGNHLSSFGEQGDASGYLTQSKGVAIDSDGHIYVADALANRIQIFNQKGDFLLEFGDSGDLPGQFRMPTGLAIWDDKIYVADSYNQRIQVFQYIKVGK